MRILACALHTVEWHFLDFLFFNLAFIERNTVIKMQLVTPVITDNESVINL